MSTGVLEKPEEKVISNEGVKTIHAYRRREVILFRRGLLDELISECGVKRIENGAKMKLPPKEFQYCAMCVLIRGQE